ncbi:MAG: hypothetical protein HRT45_17620 [Bdellovibrionales bacterium]|nr:hypothetical protein [Bdellovibrionales bacterium]
MRNIIQNIVLIAVMGTAFSASSSAHAQFFQMDLMKGRQAAKASSRWTLFDWISQKKKISLWDQWLANNRSTPIFEMQITGTQSDFETKTKTGLSEIDFKDSSQNYAMDLWVKLIGLRAELEEQADIQKTTAAMLNLRLIGSSLQSTHLIIRGGLQQLENLTDGRIYQNPFAAAALRLYFLSFIGLQGEYRHLLEAESDEGGIKFSGTRTKGGAFIEWGIFRISGQYINEPYRFDSSGTITEQTRSGVEYGIQIIL